MLHGDAHSAHDARTHRRWAWATTLGDLLDQRATELPDQEAAVFPTERVTYAELAERADTYARNLVGLGVRSDDRVGILLPGSVDLLAMLFAAAKVGAISVPLNARFKHHELRQVIVHSGMKVLVTTAADNGGPDFPGLLMETIEGLATQQGERLALESVPELHNIVLLSDDNSAGMTSSRRFARAGETISGGVIADIQHSVRIRDTALLVYTSGTTASPKGALLSHEALVRLSAGIAFERMLLEPDDRVWTAIPLFHGGGVTFALTCVTAGATFIHPGFFDPTTTLDYLERERVTVALAAFETIWLPVLNQPDFDKHDLSRIKLVMVVGVPERLREMSCRLPDATHVSCVAMTESSAFLTLNYLEDPAEKRTTTGGHPLPGMRCRVVDPETGADLPAGEAGELLFTGPNAFSGYFRDPELTRQAFDDDGWFHSGDIVQSDSEGRLTFLSRLKDMLKVGGENVSAAEVEGYLLSHPAVNIVAVVAAPDAYYGEVPAAFVEIQSDMRVTEEELIDYCLGQIATYRVPRYVRFITEWPSSGTKIQKFRLREIIANELASRGVTEAPKVRSSRAPTSP